MSAASLVGQTLGGRYQIQSLIGRGGMASVYKAYDPNLRRDVAIKVIHPHLSDNPVFFRRFEEEATAIARLRHPNIVQVYDFSHDGDLYYMVMEFVRGETLQTRLKKLTASSQRLSIREAITFTAEICEAVNYAHKRGMIHRDIKPANIILDEDGSAILMDFGIARMVGASQHTATGTVLGTAMYMSPEQIQGLHIDTRADIYSIGITLFEMLSGKPPFEAESAITLMMMHLNYPIPDLRELKPDIPPELIAITNKALAKNPAERYQSAGEMSATLRVLQEKLRDTSGAGTQPALPLPESPEVTFIEATGQRDKSETFIEPSDSITPVVNQPTFVEAAGQTTGPKARLAVATIPEKTAIFQKYRSGWILMLSLLAILLLGFGGYTAYKVFVLKEDLFSLLSSPIVETLETYPITDEASAEVTSTPSPTSQGKPTSITIIKDTPSPTSTKISADINNPHGKIVFTCQVYQDPERDQICIINVDGTGFRQLTDESSNYYASLAPDGRSVVFVSFRTDHWEIYELVLNSNEIKPITFGQDEWAAPEISPDGRYIVATKNTNDIQGIWLMDRNGDNQHPLVEKTVDCLDPTWSHDGEKVLFACGLTTERQLYTIDIKNNEIKQITNLANLRGRSDWSQDGNEIASYLGTDWHREIVILSNSGTILKYLTQGGNNLAPSYSPDDAWITFMSYKDLYGDNDGCEIYIMLNDGSEVRRLTENNYCDWQPRWGP